MTAIIGQFGSVGGDGNVGAPGLSFAGDPTSGFYRNGSTSISLSMLGAESVRFLTASGFVNRIEQGGAATGFRVGFRARGSDAAVGFSFDTQAAGDTLFTSAQFNSVNFQVIGSAAGAVNYLGAQGGTTGLPAKLIAVGEANVGIALIPKGTGAFTAATPDSAVTGGNARGASAVDWQLSRSAATQVASGTSSTVGGGLNNTASGSSATVAGGQSGTAAGSAATVGGGQSNSASGISGTVAGGQNNTADGSYSWAPGGLRATARGMIGRGSWAAGQFALQGDAQAAECVLRAATADATQTQITADGAAGTATNQLIVTVNSVQLVKLMVTARQLTTGDSAGWVVDALFKRGASIGTTVLVGGGGAALAPNFNDAGAAAWRLAVVADAVTRGAVNLMGTGEAAKSIQWVARVLSVENVG